MKPTDQNLLDRWTLDGDAHAFAELVARHGRMVLAVCRRILRDATLADDLAQECFLQLAHSPHRPRGDVGAWLHRVATNGSISALREAAARPASLPDLDPPQHSTPRLAEWREMEAHVDAAIAALPETLRSVVVGHFLEGRSHRELARAFGLGDRTVGYRIAKGIERLRRELAARGVRLDHGALATALFALPTPTALPATWSASLGKVALVGPSALGGVAGAVAVGWAAIGSAKSMLVGAAALMALLLGGLWFATPSEVPVERSGSGPEAAPRVASSATSEHDAHATDDRVVVTDQPGAASPSEAADDGMARIVGRCVDTSGNPVRGARVELFGSVANNQTIDAWRLNHGDIDWANPEPVATDSQGRFEVLFTPLEPYQFTCRVSCEGCVSLSARWSAEELQPGSVEDLGDIVLEPGTVVFGRVVDTAGLPVAERNVVARRSNGQGTTEREAARRMRPRDQSSCQSGKDGSFELGSPLPRGIEIEFLVHGRPVLQPDTALRIDGDRMHCTLVASIAGSGPEGLTIRGQVQDEAGEPVGSAELFISAEPTFTTRRVDTRPSRDGRFVLRRAATSDDPDPVALHVQAFGFVPWTSDAPIAWGSDAVGITLRSGPALEVRAVRGDDSKPVERFAVQISPVQADGSNTNQHDRLLGLGDHPNGLFRIERVTPARFRLSVEVPDGLGLLSSYPRVVEVREGGPVRVDVVVPALCKREVQVAYADGSPVSGAKVELLRHLEDGEVNLGMMALPKQSARVNHPQNVAELVALQTTNSEGRAVLEGPGGTRLALRLPGPGHLPLILQPVQLDQDGPLVVRVSRGGTVAGIVRPREVVDQLQLEGRRDESDREQLVGIRLRSTSDPRIRFPDPASYPNGAPLDKEGGFRITGVPAGSWDVEIGWRVVIGTQGGDRTVHTTASKLRTGVVTKDGDDLRLDLDLEALRRQAVMVSVSNRGEPLVARVMLDGQVRSPLGGEPEHVIRYVVTDSTGEVAAALQPGSWRTRVDLRLDGTNHTLDGPEFVLNTASEPTAWRIDFNLGTRRIRVERPDGSPAVKVGFEDMLLVSTDSNGRATFLGPIGPLRLRAARAPLSDLGKRMMWLRTHSPEEHSKAFVDLGDVELLPGDSDELVFRLPDAWLDPPD